VVRFFSSPRRPHLFWGPLNLPWVLRALSAGVKQPGREGDHLPPTKAVPHFRRLVAGFPPLRPGFEPRSGHVGFVVDKVALEQVFSEYKYYVFGYYPSSCPYLNTVLFFQDTTQLGQIDRASPYLGQEIETSSVHWSQLSRFYLKTETESSLRNVVF
jgi:hypothetical protein